MRWVISGACLFLSIVIVMASSGTESDAPANREIARPADELVDSICVVTHLPYADTPYGAHYPAVRSKLTALGIRHIRDGGTSPEVLGRMRQLADLGIKTTFVLDPNMGTKPDAAYWATPPNFPIDGFVENKVCTDTVDAVEMHNELDLFHGNTRSYPGDRIALSDDPRSSRYWGDYIRVATPDTRMALKSNPTTARIPLFGPSFTSEEAYAIVGDLSSSVDAANVHWYPGGRHPETDGWGDDGYGGREWTIEHLGRKQSPSDPVVATEGGYSTATGAGPTNIPEDVHGKYVPRLFLHAFDGGFRRFCSYELVDEWPDPAKANPEANFGLLRNDLSEKPAYGALKNLVELLEDSGPAFTPRPLGYALSGEVGSLRHLLLQKRDGRFYLVLWLGKPSWDPVNGRAMEVPAKRVTLTLERPAGGAAAYLPGDSAPHGRWSGGVDRLKLEVPDHPLVVEIEPAAARRG